MKSKWKRLGSLLLAAIMSVAVLGTTAYATEGGEGEASYTYTDPYVLTFTNLDSVPESYQQYCVPYMWASSHNASMSIKDYETGEWGSWYCSAEMYNLINTAKLQENSTEEGPYASIPAYCTDACVSTVRGSSYQRINLEDSSYYDDEAAGRIRAVFLNSFPTIKDMSVLESKVNAWIAENQPDASPVSGLTGAEAVTATQYTIWSIANGEDVAAKRAYARTYPITEEEDLAQIIYPDGPYVNASEEADANTSNNITMLAAYLQSLAPMAPSQVSISDGSVQIQEIVTALEGDTYTMTVRVKVSATIDGDDDLVLTAACGEERQNVTLTAENADEVHTFTFSGLESPDVVTVEVNGYQSVADVFFFDAVGGRGTSQTLVGYDDSKLPVHGEAVAQPDRELVLYKYAPISEGDQAGDGTVQEVTGRIPLANIEFEIYQVAAMEEIQAGTVVLNTTPTEEEIAKYLTAENLVATICTDEKGLATYNFTEHENPDGVYMVVEKENDAVEKKADPFYISVPMTNPAGDGWLYVIHVYPKNNVKGGPEIDKDVTKLDNKHDSYDVGDEITWIIRSDVPEDLYYQTTAGEDAFAKKYTITDTLDSRLDYIQGSVSVKLYNKDGAEVDLSGETDYTLTETTTTNAQGKTVDQFIVELTQAGMKKVTENLGTGEESAEIRVYFKTVINSSAQMGTEIPNNAVLRYTNSNGYEYEPTEVEDQPEVHTGGLNVLKYDVENTEKLLAGAVFKIAREATAEDLANAQVDKVTIEVDNEKKTVVYVDFYPTADLSGDKVYQVTTGVDGKAVIYGLAYGEYYLVETTAPEGYNKLAAPVKVTINESSHLTGEDADTSVPDNTVKVSNSAKFTLPATGGMGTVIFRTVGLCLIGAAALVLGFMVFRRKEMV